MFPHSFADSLVRTWTREGYEGMTSSMNNQGTSQTLKTLFPKPPNEVLAVTAKRGLFEESWSESVIVSNVIRSENVCQEKSTEEGRKCGLKVKSSYRCPLIISTCFFLTAPCLSRRNPAKSRMRLDSPLSASFSAVFVELALELEPVDPSSSLILDPRSSNNNLLHGEREVLLLVPRLLFFSLYCSCSRFLILSLQSSACK